MSEEQKSSGPHKLKSAFSFWYLNKRKEGPAAPTTSTTSAPTSSTTTSSASTSSLTPSTNSTTTSTTNTSSTVLASPTNAVNYSEALYKVCTFSTVEEFWAYYSHLQRPVHLPNSINFHLFREGITPIWEDPANAQGGKWMLRLRKGMSSRAWENAVLAVIGDAFHLGDEICGAVLVSKNNEDILSIWNKNATNKEANNRIRDTLRRVLELPSSAHLEYRAHDDAMKNVQANAAAANTQNQNHSQTNTAVTSTHATNINNRS